ncbi:MAG TPA: gliding motility-associated C-terminal domain-containing protein [Saprospiraceae bacterium]|nr:gliding motility-associated C-terminal domain-containing protein [Saprospiraceae bacterium]HMP22602.1 gliding motility-associated C-terminal domain-containing protein [Saprospiraceae bacterium]
MIKYTLSTLLFLFVFCVTYAQRPAAIRTAGSLGKAVEARAKMECNDAGTVTFGTHRGQSNDVTPDTIYLCFGDELDIIHNRDADLSGDPVPATPAGIGYGFYTCRPTVSGPDAASIRNDPCQVNMPPAPNGFYVAPGANLEGDITFVNDGFLQTTFNNGNPRLWWFAPITYDRLNGFNAEYEGDPAGPCVDVNVDAAFAVVYLNAIAESEVNTMANPSGCRGSFVLRGGLPELDPLARYTIDISLEGNPSVRGNIVSGGAPIHGSRVTFFVPQAGVYNITVTDGKSCGRTFTMDMSACTGVTFSLPAVSALPGDNICVPVTADNFNMIGTTQFSIHWDPAVIRFTQVGAFNPELTGLESGSFNANINAGRLSFAWFDTALDGATVPDGATLFEICFNVIGTLGQRSLLTFSNEPTPILVGDTSLTDLGFITRNGIVALTTNEIIPLLEQDSVSCPGELDGAFTMRLFGGTAPYTFRWRPLNPPGAFEGPFTINNADEPFRVSNLGSGRYEVVIQDSNNPVNTTTDTVQVLRGPLIGAGLESVRPACFGDSTGQVRVLVDVEGVTQTNPENRFTFTWNRATPTNTSVLTNLPFGSYAVTVTDRDGCTVTASSALSQPPQVNAIETVTNASCSGSEDGTITVNGAGGVAASGNYTFRWSHVPDSIVAPTSAFNNLDPGRYTVTVTDDNNCQTTETYTVGAVKTLAIQTLALEDVTCNGDDNGRISVRGSTTPNNLEDLPYTFNWQGPGTITPNSTPNESAVENLVAGTYVLTMIDSDPQGCQLVDTFVINEPLPLEITIVSQQNETCTVGNDGSATIAVTGGTFPYTFAWSDGQTDSIAMNLRSDRYVVEVTDANGCLDSLEVIITAPTPPTIAPIAPASVSCQNSTDGSLTATATPVPGTTITGYQWSNGGTGTTITNLSPGLYAVTVTASDGCINVDTASVIAPDPLVVDSIVATAPTCVGFDNGRLTVFASGGTAPYRYIWANTPQNDTLTANVYGQLTAGTYQLTVIDANNCAPATSTATLNDPPGIDISFSAVSGVSCFENTCDGRATATAIYTDGRQGTFTFSWQSGEVSSNTDNSTASQLCAGFQVVVATDANNCFALDTVNIPSPPAIIVQVDVEPVSCNGFSDGAITLTPDGGTPPFNIQWQETGATTNAISNLTAGLYNAVLTDSNGCTKTQIVELNEPARLELSLDLANTTPSVSCSGDNDGRIRVVYNINDNVNPVGPEPYTWSGGIAPPASPLATNLSPGTYSVTITDVRGCTDSLSYTILEPQPLVAIIPQPEAPRCFGESTLILIDTIFGGTGISLFDYTYELNNNGLRFPPNQPATVFAGTQIITISDPAGCTFSDTLVITEPTEIQVFFDPAVVEVELGDSTTLQPIINSSLPINSYAWNPDTYLSANDVPNPVVSPQTDRTYTLTVLDANGCSGSGVVRVEVDFSRNVFIPNIFSPNGDGPNDDFRIFTCNGVTAIRTVHIFDRWGNLMISLRDLPPGCTGGVRLWDGRFNNKLVSPGVYVYMIEIEFLDNLSLTYRGDVTVVR